eukprot:TRINITY_DN20365_c0_g2_i1.p1 TRINITY_DN20365_c0_g2~~TRINITY_DN20365_c0_g2_i1.p1  ORF type:complete len:401 (-),score=50.69 TRINITY_DN20365_c0_g2_i1:41-1243(-)
MEICARSLLTHELLACIPMPATGNIEDLRRQLCAELRTRQEYLELFSETGEELRSVASGDVLVSLRPPAEDALLLFMRGRVISRRVYRHLSETLEPAEDIEHVAYLLEFVDPNKQDGEWRPFEDSNRCFGCTALHYAVLAGYARCAALILQHPSFSSPRAKCCLASFLWPGIRFSETTAEDVEALHCVALAKQGPGLLRLLLACPKIDPNAKCTERIWGRDPTQSTILTLAANVCRKDLLQVLVQDTRVDMNARNSAGHKVLTQLCRAANYADECYEEDCNRIWVCAHLVLASGRCNDPCGRSLYLEATDTSDADDVIVDPEANAKFQVAMDRQRNQRCRRRERHQSSVKKLERRSGGRQPGFQMTRRRTLRKESRVHMKAGWLLDADDVLASCELVRVR